MYFKTCILYNKFHRTHIALPKFGLRPADLDVGLVQPGFVRLVKTEAEDNIGQYRNPVPFLRGCGQLEPTRISNVVVFRQNKFVVRSSQIWR